MTAYERDYSNGIEGEIPVIRISGDTEPLTIDVLQSLSSSIAPIYYVSEHKRQREVQLSDEERFYIAQTVEKSLNQLLSGQTDSTQYQEFLPRVYIESADGQQFWEVQSRSISLDSFSKLFSLKSGVVIKLHPTIRSVIHSAIETGKNFPHMHKVFQPEVIEKISEYNARNRI